MGENYNYISPKKANKKRKKWKSSKKREKVEYE